MSLRGTAHKGAASDGVHFVNSIYAPVPRRDINFEKCL